jgi:hypothetical protein
MAKNQKSAKSLKAGNALATLDPTEGREIETTVQEETKAIEATVLPGTLPEGMVSYLVYDAVTGSVFVSEQAANRAYISAVVADSPLGRKVVRLTSDHKSALRYAKAINTKGASACSNAVVLDVHVDNKPHREQIAQGIETTITRNPKVLWNAAIEAREAARNE